MQTFGLIPSKRHQVFEQAVSAIISIGFVWTLFSALPLAFWLLTLNSLFSFPSLISQSWINKRSTFKWHLLSNVPSLSWNTFLFTSLPKMTTVWPFQKKFLSHPSKDFWIPQKKAFDDSCVAPGGEAEEEGEKTIATDQNGFLLLLLLRPGTVTHVCNSSIWEQKEGRIRRLRSSLAT